MSRAWWPFTPALRRQRQGDLFEFETSPVCKSSSSTAKAVTQRKLVLKNKKANPLKKQKQKQKTEKELGLSSEVEQHA